MVSKLNSFFLFIRPDLEVLWLRVRLVVWEKNWLNQLSWVLFLKVFLDLFRSVCNYSLRLIGLDKSSIFAIEWRNMVTFPRWPIIYVFVIFYLFRFRSSWGFIVELNICLIFFIKWCYMIAMAWCPIFIVFCIFNFFRFSSCWRSYVYLSLSLEIGAVIESTFNKFKEVSNKLRFLCFINTFKKFRVHLRLKEFIHVNFKVGFKKCLFS